MTREEIGNEIIELIKANQPGFEKIEIKEDTRINMEAGFDSMTFVYIMCKIESIFDISIPKRRWEKMMTLGDVIDAVEKELGKKK